MSRITQTFERLAREGRTGLIPFFTAGDPSRESTPGLMHTLVEAGADIIEMGVPFSDPMADGPVIQAASERALAQGVSLRDCLKWVADFRQIDVKTPVVLMGYANPIERIGVDAFIEQARASGVDGVLVVDYPPEEAESFAIACDQKGIAPIFLLAPTSTDGRIAQAAALGRGYLYYVSLTGITGAGHFDANAVLDAIPRLKSLTGLPIGVGFGIKDAQSAVAIAKRADAVVIGSQLIREMAARPDAALDAAAAFLRPIRQALDAARHATEPSQ